MFVELLSVFFFFIALLVEFAERYISDVFRNSLRSILKYDFESSETFYHVTILKGLRLRQRF